MQCKRSFNTRVCSVLVTRSPFDWAGRLNLWIKVVQCKRPFNIRVRTSYRSREGKSIWLKWATFGISRFRFSSRWVKTKCFCERWRKKTNSPGFARRHEKALSTVFGSAHNSDSSRSAHNLLWLSENLNEQAESGHAPLLDLISTGISYPPAIGHTVASVKLLLS